MVLDVLYTISAVLLFFSAAQMFLRAMKNKDYKIYLKIYAVSALVLLPVVFIKNFT
ncbi:hypothetical protein [Lysinibacillus sp. 54212]|uniref:hypothetical protein n=1 Tax=Lysinibacillus sp. 54212 TaxID=3119829 RepID=UPI002FC8A501